MKLNFKFKLTSLINWKNYFYFILVYLSIIVGLTIFFRYFFVLDSNYVSKFKDHSIQNVLTILYHNTLNFLQYIFFSPLMPILLFLDCTTTSWAVNVSILNKGLFPSLIKLLPHGLIEIPNFCLYVYISYSLMKEFYSNIKNKNHSYFQSITKYKTLLISNFILIIIAAIIEGLIT